MLNYQRVTLGSVRPHRNMRYWWNSKHVGLIRNGSRRWDENSTQLALHVLIPCHMNPIISPSYHHVNWLNPLKSHPHWWNPINLQPLSPMFSDEIPKNSSWNSMNFHEVLIFMGKNPQCSLEVPHRTVWTPKLPRGLISHSQVQLPCSQGFARGEFHLSGCFLSWSQNI